MPYALKRIADAGVRVWCYLTSQEVKRDTVVDRVQSSVMAFVDEMHREQARERTRDAMRRKAERGHVAGGAVYGTATSASTAMSSVRSSPQRRRPIRRIFTEISDGAGYVKIAKRLNAEGVPSPIRAGWAGSGVREVLFRQLYRGRLVYGKTRWEDRGGRRVKVRMPEPDWIIVEAPGLQIIDPSLWRDAHARLDRSRAAYSLKIRRRPAGPRAGVSESPYLLTGFMTCASCGGTLQVSHQPSRGAPRPAPAVAGKPPGGT